MMRRRLNPVALLLALICGTSAAHASSDRVTLPSRSLASPLALPVSVPEPMRFEPIGDPAGVVSSLGDLGDTEGVSASLLGRKRQPGEARPKRVRPPVTLSAERARVLLRSLTVPGWGQLTTGHRTAATVFGLAELGVWSTYTAFRIQTVLRRDAYRRTARVLAGIDLSGRDEEFQRIVGAFLSSDEYNQLVVARDAANLHYDDPVAFQQYYDEHSLKGADAWAWTDEQSLLRYRGQRKDSQRAALRANAALAMAVVNRLLSGIHAARLGTGPGAQSWELQTLPASNDPTALRVGVLRRF